MIDIHAITELSTMSGNLQLFATVCLACARAGERPINQGSFHMRIRPVTRIALIAALASLGGCERNSDTPPLTKRAAIAACPAPDTAGLGPDPWAVTFNGPVRALLDSLDAQVAMASADKLPALLLARGRAKSAYQPNAVLNSTDAAHETDAAYAKSRPDEYGYNEVGADWLYNGKDFRDLIKRFPASPLVDDAAYELTRLPIGGECEESVACMVWDGWASVGEFLRAHPNARQADFAVARALEAFRSVDSGRDIRLGSDADEPAAIRNMVAALDTVARLQTAPRRTQLLMRAGELWDRYADYDRARSAFAAAGAAADPSVRNCIEARLAAMPASGFLLDTTRVINPHRVELRWQSPSTIGNGQIVYRSFTRSDTGSVVARVGPNDRTWTDTAARPDTTYWYRVAIDAPGVRARSNPASASTPSWHVDVQRIAVSTQDRRLYLFGFLANGFQQVLSVSADGASVERHDGLILGVNRIYRTANAFDAYTNDVWIVDGGGVGVLRFHKNGAELPASLFAALRRGGGFLRGPPSDEPSDLSASVDEARTAAWLEYRGVIVAMDCAGAARVCWNGKGGEALLRNDTGAVVTKVPLPSVPGHGDEFAMAVFAESSDSSAWLWLFRSTRLLHVGRMGTTLGELQIGKPGWYYGPAFTVDRDRHTLWFTRIEPVGAVCGAPKIECRMEIVQLDMRRATPEPHVIATIKPFASTSVSLAPDLSGGVWLLVDQTVQRIDSTGRTLFTVTLKDR